VVRIVVTVIVIAVVGYFFTTALADNWSQVAAIDYSPSWEAALAAVCFVAAVPLTGLLWRAIVERLQDTERVGIREAIAVQSASWLLKYVPGQLGSFVYKMSWGLRRGLPRSLVGVSFVYENIFLVLAGTVPPVAVLAVTIPFADFAGSLGTIALPLIAVVPLLALASPAVLHRLVGAPVERLLHERLERSNFLPGLSAMGFALAFLGPRILNGIGFVAIVQSVHPVPATAWIPLASAYILAGVAGLLAIFVPSGIGVREAVIVLFASLYLPLPVAIVTALVARLISTVSDVLVAGLWAATRHALPRAAAA